MRLDRAQPHQFRTLTITQIYAHEHICKTTGAWYFLSLPVVIPEIALSLIREVFRHVFS
jgi:hypothetical protein